MYRNWCIFGDKINVTIFMASIDNCVREQHFNGKSMGHSGFFFA